MPAVVFTEPEIAWCGITENEAKAKGVTVGAAKFPWSASGRAMTLAEPVGQTKVIYDPQTTAVLGVGIVGPRAGELIAEAVLAIEMGAVLEDLLVTIHPHPTLSETLADATAAAISRIERQKARDTETQAAPH
jgi:dihydrolipoamide dehydrogenase